jgi:sulfite reductase alpha subunit-like flavoprotein
LKDLKYAVFGLGDSGYLYFNEAARKIDDRLA